ncbi:ABC transporter substrate-binding protein [Variovorax sp. Sphag1AA]|uniref:ABC transporter substrate-binding protein n=1 Tax=Variovorax sp. Sphag1AA TaxID=2587027 RepID=UPI0016131553|nr:ABC transporter substrate-binding protein [Variovorax sp. Sphag1AA]MBB3181341.1 branched-chain amino acid transport system substrate-binding protein [Variovorax sp. Sphag1AA]
MIRKLFRCAALALALGGATLAANAADPIKIGLVLIDSGPFASNYGMGDSAKLAVDLLNAQGGALGRKFELAVQTHPGTPAGAISAVTRAVQQDGASFFTGMFFSSMALALGPRLQGLNALMLDSNSQSDDLIGKNCQANYFRTAANDGTVINAFRSYLAQSDAKTWNIIATDFAGGHDFARKFTALVQERGGSVGLTLFNPLGTADFGSFISQLNTKPADGLAVMVVGTDAVTFAKQQQQFGLLPKYKTVLSNTFTNDIVLGAQGDSTMGVIAGISYLSSLPGAKNAAFVKAFESRYKRRPNFIEADVYVSLEMLQAAIVKAGSTDVAAVRKALAGLKTETIYGDVEMRAADHQLVRQMLMAEVVKGEDGKPGFAIRSVYPGTSNTPPANPECKL